MDSKEPSIMFATQRKVRNNSADTYIQPQLEVGSPDDEYEQGTNNVADKVMRMSEGEQMPKKSAGKENTQMMSTGAERPKMIDPNAEKIKKMEPHQKVLNKTASDDEKKIGTITGGEEVVAALKKTPYGTTLVQTLFDSGLNYTINVVGNTSTGNFGAPEASIEDGVLTGYTLNFQKYRKSNLYGTRFDNAGKEEYYGAILAHEVIDTATSVGREVNIKKEADWLNLESDYQKAYQKWQKPKTSETEKEAAKLDFFQFLIDNYEKIGMDAEFKFRQELDGNTLDTPIGRLSLQQEQAGRYPDIEGKTPRDIYEKGVK